MIAGILRIQERRLALGIGLSLFFCLHNRSQKHHYLCDGHGQGILCNDSPIERDSMISIIGVEHHWGLQFFHFHLVTSY